MSNTNTAVATQEPNTLSALVKTDNVMNRLKDVLGKRASAFATSIIQIQSQNEALKKCDPKSILNAAMVSATLDLPINNQIGHTWIVPYGTQAQFQIGYKGFIQLAQRSGQFLKLNVTEVYENQFKSWNAMTEELDADFMVNGSGKVVGYVAYFKLSNGFEKIVFWTIEKVTAHAKRHSKTFASGPWKTDFDKMAMKTVIKDMLNKWAPLSIEMQIAIKADQAIINDENAEDVTYVDSAAYEVQDLKSNVADNTEDRLKQLILSSKDEKELNQRLSTLSDAQKELVKDHIVTMQDTFEAQSGQTGDKKELF